MVESADINGATALEHTLREVLIRTYSLTTDADLDRICSAAELIEVKAGKTLVQQGEQADDMHILLRGRMRAISRDGEQMNVVGDIAAGETIGELGFVTGRTRGADVVAMRDCQVATLDRKAVEALIAAKPDFAFTITRLVAERYERAAEVPSRLPPPRCIAVAALTPDLEHAQCAEALGESAAGFRMTTTVVRETDVTDANATHTTLERAEAESDGPLVLSLGSDVTGAWSETCLAQADELIFFASVDKRGDVDNTVLEIAKRAASAEAAFAKRITLAIIHPWSTNCPRDTSLWLDLVPANRHVHCAGLDPHGISRLARIVTGRARGFVLSGGGARGFAHLGVCKALAEFGIKPDLLGGTSFGAIVCAWLSMGLDGDALIEEAKETFVRSYKGKVTGDYNWLPMVSLVKGQRARDVGERSMARMSGYEDGVGIEDAWINTFVISSNFSTISEEIMERGDYVQSLMASFAIPGALPPVLSNGNFLFDGGSFNNFPTDVMAARGAHSIIGIDLASDRGRRVKAKEIPSNFAMLVDKLRSIKKRRHRFPGVLETLTNAAFVSAIAQQRELRKQTDLLIRPQLPGIGMLQWGKFDRAVRQGYTQTKARLEGMSDAELERLQ
ncbi:MAG: patatin-like phospholipase family protein [Pseudomonadota bacterium]